MLPWRVQLFVLPSGDAWRVTMHVDDESSSGLLREFRKRDAAVHYARVLAQTLDPTGAESKVWIDQVS